MKVFLSYASEERPIAERICRVLESEGHDVFFDRDDLAGGEIYGARIREAIDRCDAFVFLVSPNAIAPSYALTELSLLEARPPHQRPPIVPVLAAPTDLSNLPPLLRPLTVLEPRGDLPAEVAARVHAFDIVPAAQRVRLLGMPGNGGWSVYVDIADTDVREIFYRVNESSSFASAGLNEYRNPHTGRQLPNPLLTLPGRLGQEHNVEVKYIDGRDREIGPFIVRFDARAQFVRFTKDVLAKAPEWIAFAEQPPDKLLVYFSALISWKNAFTDIRFSIDDESLARQVRFAADWSKRSVPGFNMNTDDTYIEAPIASRFVAVKLFFIDGTQSDLRRFVVAESDVAGR
jgi:hypothetical protein